MPDPIKENVSPLPSSNSIGTSDTSMIRSIEAPIFSGRFWNELCGSYIVIVELGFCISNFSLPQSATPASKQLPLNKASGFLCLKVSILSTLFLLSRCLVNTS